MEANKNNASEEARKQEAHKYFEALQSLSINWRIHTAGVPADLIERGKAFSIEHGKALASVLASAGVQADTITAVLCDYQDVLTGRCILSATPEQMQEVKGKCDAGSLYKIYEVDSVGAFSVLLILLYWGRLELCRDYEKYVSIKSPTATLETRREFFREGISGTAALNMYWLFRKGLIKEEDLSEIPEDGEPAPLEIFFTNLSSVSVGAYLVYYVVARYALGITKEEARRILTPVEHSGQEEKYRNLAEDIATHVLEKAKQAGECLKGGTSQEEAAAAGKVDLSETIVKEIDKDVCLPRIFSIINSEPRVIHLIGNESDTLVQMFWESLKHNDKAMAELEYLSDGQTGKVISGFQKMITVKPYEMNGTKRVYNLGYTEFGALCGSQPGSNELKCNIVILNKLSGVPFRLPAKKIPYTDANGNTKTFDPNERNEAVYIKLFSVPMLIEGANSRVIVEIEDKYATVENGKYVPSVFFDLLKEAQSDTERHAYYQMITKNHKNKEDFKDAAFGYSATDVWARETKDECKRKMYDLIDKSPELSAGGISAGEDIEAQRAKIRSIAKQWSEAKSAAGPADIVTKRTNYICDYAEALDKLQEATEKEAKMRRNRTAHKKRDLDKCESYFMKAEARGLIYREKKNDKATFWWEQTNAGQEEQVPGVK